MRAQDMGSLEMGAGAAGTRAGAGASANASKRAGVSMHAPVSEHVPASEHAGVSMRRAGAATREPALPASAHAATSARRAGAAAETPSSIMYADLKLFGHISNRDAARLLLSPAYLVGGVPIRNRANNRTFLSRDVVHARPHEIVPQRFANIPQASLTLAAKTLTYLGGDERARTRFLQHYQDEAPRAMRASLDSNGLEGTAYANALAKIEHIRFSPDKDRGLLYFMLFVATGCLCDPVRAAQTVEDFASRQLASELHTIETSVGSAFPPSIDTAAEAKPAGMGLLRIIDGMVKPPLRKLSTERSGTVIGAFASGPHGISDVDGDVSRRHLRIWYENGSWWVQGLGSTNGSTLISGDTREVRVIEPPRRERKGAVGASPQKPASADEAANADEETPAESLWPPVEIMNSDMLCLGATTRFLVMQITE